MTRASAARVARAGRGGRPRVGAPLRASVAWADAASDAKALFVRGRALRAAGDCASAVPVFHEAYALYPAALGPLRNIAECDEALGDRGAARQAWLDLGRALGANAEAKYAGWSEDAAKAAERLAPPPQATKAAPSGVADPQADAHPAPLLATSDVPAEDSVSEKGVATRRAVAWVAIGVGAASLVGAGASWLVRQSALNELRDKCETDPDGNFFHCTPDASSASARGSTATTVADVLGVVGVIGVAGGVVLLATGPASAKHVAVGMSPAGVWAGGRF